MSTRPKSKSSNWHKKIAQARGKKWLDSVKEGRKDALLNPSKIRLYRLRKNVLQSDIAKALKMSEATFGGIERGKRPVKRPIAKEIASYLGTSYQNLFTQKKGDKFIALIHKQNI